MKKFLIVARVNVQKLYFFSLNLEILYNFHTNKSKNTNTAYKAVTITNK